MLRGAVARVTQREAVARAERRAAAVLAGISKVSGTARWSQSAVRLPDRIPALLSNFSQAVMAKPVAATIRKLSQ
jgi:hypothetical protein